ncbi:hypothetical protein MBLNU230_g2023t1 [Neophaeotheca triangularis]
MDGGALGLLKFLAPQVPSLTTTAASHAIGFAPNSSKWDLRTTLTVSVIRNLMTGNGGKPSPISKTQATTLKDPGIKGKTWVAKATFAAPSHEEEGLREAVFGAIDQMKEGEVNYVKPYLADIEVEWTGYRPNAGKEEGLPDISEEDKYTKMLAEPERTSDTVVLYFHGGAYYLCDPTTHRASCSRLAKETQGVVVSTRYRLAPQAAFPSQLLDALMCYLTLLYPPPNSLHRPIPASNIVLGGDSAGGNLAFALLQLLLQLHRTAPSNTTPKLRFHGREVEVPLPAGCSANSGWFDITRSMPSITTNQRWDYLPPADHDTDALSRFPADDIWPANPPRGDLFSDLSLLTHPLVSPLLADTWANSPPLFFSTGQELLTDEDKILAARAANQNVKVVYEEYEAMPHCFSMMLPALSTSDRAMRSWGRFLKGCVENPGGVEASGVWVEAKTGREEKREVKNVAPIEWAEVWRLAKDAQSRRVKGYEKEGKGMPKPAL